MGYESCAHRSSDFQYVVVSSCLVRGPGNRLGHADETVAVVRIELRRAVRRLVVLEDQIRSTMTVVTATQMEETMMDEAAMVAVP